MGRGYWLPPQHDNLTASDGFYVDSSAVYGSDSYEQSSANGTFKVSKVSCTSNVTVNDTNVTVEVPEDAEGNITDVTVDYTEGYIEQHLRYSRDYSFLPDINYCSLKFMV